MLAHAVLGRCHYTDASCGNLSSARLCGAVGACRARPLVSWHRQPAPAGAPSTAHPRPAPAAMPRRVQVYGLQEENWSQSALSIVVVGASGDLAKKKIFPALFALFYDGHLPEVRCGRGPRHPTPTPNPTHVHPTECGSARAGRGLEPDRTACSTARGHGGLGSAPALSAHPARHSADPATPAAGAELPRVWVRSEPDERVGVPRHDRAQPHLQGGGRVGGGWDQAPRGWCMHATAAAGAAGGCWGRGLACSGRCWRPVLCMPCHVVCGVRVRLPCPALAAVRTAGPRLISSWPGATTTRCEPGAPAAWLCIGKCISQLKLLVPF